MPVPSVLTNALGLDSCFLSHMNTMWPPQLNWPRAHTSNFMSICFSIMIIDSNNALVAALLLFRISLFSNYEHSVVFRSPTVPANIFITVKATWPVRNSFSVIACFLPSTICSTPLSHCLWSIPQLWTLHVFNMPLPIFKCHLFSSSLFDKPISERIELKSRLHSVEPVY